MAAWTADHVFQISCLPTLPGAPFPTPSCIQQCRYINLHLLPTFSPHSRHRPCLLWSLWLPSRGLIPVPAHHYHHPFLYEHQARVDHQHCLRLLRLRPVTLHASRAGPQLTLFPGYSAPLDTHTTCYSTSNFLGSFLMMAPTIAVPAQGGMFHTFQGVTPRKASADPQDSPKSSGGSAAKRITTPHACAECKRRKM